MGVFRNDGSGILHRFATVHTRSLQADRQNEQRLLLIAAIWLKSVADRNNTNIN